MAIIQVRSDPDPDPAFREGRTRIQFFLADWIWILSMPDRIRNPGQGHTARNLWSWRWIDNNLVRGWAWEGRVIKFLNFAHKQTLGLGGGGTDMSATLTVPFSLWRGLKSSVYLNVCIGLKSGNWK